MAWYPSGKRRPCPADYHDTSPDIYDWVSGRFTPPHNDGRKLETIAASIAKQFDKARAATKTAKGKSNAG